jgi:hypothetical protein
MRLLLWIIPCCGIFGAIPTGVASPAYNDAPFDQNVTKLGPEYLGVDAEATYRSLAAVGADKKGEFETSEEYTARVAANGAKPLVGSLFRDSLYAFRFAVPPEGSVYNADAQVLHFFPMWSFMSVKHSLVSLRQPGDSPPATPSAREKTYYSRFLGWKKMAFTDPAAQKQVEIGIEICEIMPVDCREPANQTLGILMTPDMARYAKSHSAFLLIGHLRQGRQLGALYAAGTRKPLVIGFEPVALWIFNVTTGDILKKVALPMVDG